MAFQSHLSGISPIHDSLPRASNRSTWSQETGVILEGLARFFNHCISPLNRVLFGVFGKAVLVAKCLTTDSCLLPRSLLFDARGSVSELNELVMSHCWGHVRHIPSPARLAPKWWCTVKSMMNPLATHIAARRGGNDVVPNNATIPMSFH